MACGLRRHALGEVLTALAGGGGRSSAELAGRLGLSRDELENLLHHLASLGLAQQTQAGQGFCGTAGDSRACSACPGSGICPLAGRPGSTAIPRARRWVLTERGRSLARVLSR